MNLDTGGTHTCLGVNYPEDHYLMTSQLQGMRQRGHRIEMTGSRKTKCPKFCHCPLQ
jgi:hypothetical protein